VKAFSGPELLEIRRISSEVYDCATVLFYHGSVASHRKQTIFTKFKKLASVLGYKIESDGSGVHPRPAEQSARGGPPTASDRPAYIKGQSCKTRDGRMAFYIRKQQGPRGEPVHMFVTDDGWTLLTRMDGRVDAGQDGGADIVGKWSET
jgi:hypothetical protein